MIPVAFLYKSISLLYFVGDDAHIVPPRFHKTKRADVGIRPYAIRPYF